MNSGSLMCFNLWLPTCWHDLWPTEWKNNIKAAQWSLLVNKSYSWKHLQSCFLKYLKSCCIYIHVYQLAVFFLPSIVGALLLFFYALGPLVDQWNSVKPLAGMCIICVCRVQIKLGPTHKKLLHSTTRGHKAAFNYYFGCVGAAEQAVNTAITYYHIIKVSWLIC